MEDSSQVGRSLDNSEEDRWPGCGLSWPASSGKPGGESGLVEQRGEIPRKTWTGPIDNMSKMEARADPNPECFLIQRYINYE